MIPNLDKCHCLCLEKDSLNNLVESNKNKREIKEYETNKISIQLLPTF